MTIHTKIASLFLTFSMLSGEVVSEGTPHLEALAKGPAGLNITASSSDLRFSDAGSVITVTVPIDSLKSGIGLRDKHMLKALESVKFDTTKIVINDSDVKRPSDGPVTSSTTGKLTLHGVTHDVRVAYDASQSATGLIDVKAKFSIDITDYGIAPPSYLGVSVKPQVDVSVDLHLASH
jgi:polyisoprenoid-binding protein YceI